MRVNHLVDIPAAFPGESHKDMRRLANLQVLPQPSTINPQPSTPNPHVEGWGLDTRGLDNTRVGAPNPRSLILNLICNVQVQRLGLIQQIHETQRLEMSLDPNEKRKQSSASLVIVPNPKLPCYLFKTTLLFVHTEGVSSTDDHDDDDDDDDVFNDAH